MVNPRTDADHITDTPHDHLAANAVRNDLASRLGSALDGTSLTEDYDAHDFLSNCITRHFTVRWERRRNGNGTPVRRPVLVGHWEVDPERVLTPETGDDARP